MDRIEQANKNQVNIVSNDSVFSIKQLETIYDAVFRESTNQPGYYFQDFGKLIDSKIFRQRMVELKNGLSKICELRLNKELNYQGAGRFNQQNTSRFHRDTAEEHAFLMLGYEPTKVDSKVYVADYSKHIESQNMSVETYFGGDEDVNTADDDQLLLPYITQLAPFPKNNYRLLLLNNSKSFKENTFGVFHRGEVLQKIEGEDRILNYMLLHFRNRTIEKNQEEQVSLNFVNTDKVAR